MFSATCVLKFCAFNACLFAELGCSPIDVELEFRCPKISVPSEITCYGLNCISSFVCDLFNMLLTLCFCMKVGKVNKVLLSLWKRQESFLMPTLFQPGKKADDLFTPIN